MVTGGVGRFSSATTAQGTVDSSGDFNQGLFGFQLTSTISAPSKSGAHGCYQLTALNGGWLDGVQHAVQPIER